MERVEYFVAFDGTKFYDEDECILYEADAKYDIGPGFMMFTDDFKIIPKLEDFDTCLYLYILDADKAAEQLDEVVYDIYGFEVPDQSIVFHNGDIFHYNCYLDEWENVREQLSNLAIVIKTLEESANRYKEFSKNSSEQ